MQARFDLRRRPAALYLMGLGLFCLLLSAVAVTPAHAQTSPTMLSGYVLNYKGDFVAGATVTLYAMPAHTAAGPVATSDDKGQWSMDTGQGTFVVQAKAPGYTSSEQVIYATSYQTGITFILREEAAKDLMPLVATVTGRVLSQDNVPLGGLNIIANNVRDTGVKQVTPPPVLNATVTNADGTYSLQVPAGEIWMTLKTGATWGYQREPVTVHAGDNVTGADFVAALRVLPRLDFPTPTTAPTFTPVPPTATPISGVAPIVVGMPRTGNGGADGFWLVLAAAGLLALLAGGVLALTGRPQRS